MRVRTAQLPRPPAGADRVIVADSDRAALSALLQRCQDWEEDDDPNGP
jgi:hypothetical protein